jgi:hypothetical protein
MHGFLQSQGCAIVVQFLFVLITAVFVFVRLYDLSEGHGRKVCLIFVVSVPSLL